MVLTFFPPGLKLKYPYISARGLKSTFWSHAYVSSHFIQPWRFLGPNSKKQKKPEKGESLGIFWQSEK